MQQVQAQAQDLAQAQAQPAQAQALAQAQAQQDQALAQAQAQQVRAQCQQDQALAQQGQRNHFLTTVCVFPPLVEGETQLDSVEIFASDMNRLQEGVFLNDSIITFYLKYLQMNAM